MVIIVFYLKSDNVGFIFIKSDLKSVHKKIHSISNIQTLIINVIIHKKIKFKQNY